MPELKQQLGGLVGRLVHDLKNPLTAVVGNLLYLKDSIPDSEEREAVVESLAAALRLDRMLDNASDLVQLLAGRQPLARVPLFVPELEPEVRRALELDLGDRSLVIGLPAVELITEGALLLRILLAVLQHAVRNTPGGGTVELAGSVDPARGLELQIRDGGLPFEPGTTPSFVADDLPGRRMPAEGYRSDQGLGLHFAGRAARCLGADVALSSREREPGIVFHLVFPRELLA